MHALRFSDKPGIAAVGYAAQLSNTTAALRRDSGCFDTDNNSADFVTGGPNPRNTSSPVHDCTSLSGFGSANPSTVLQGDSTTLSVYVAFGQNPTSTGITVTADLSSIGGSSTQAFAGLHQWKHRHCKRTGHISKLSLDRSRLRTTRKYG